MPIDQTRLLLREVAVREDLVEKGNCRFPKEHLVDVLVAPFMLGELRDRRLLLSDNDGTAFKRACNKSF
jgi:hypothetical protein